MLTPSAPPRLYIEEWMATVDGLDRKTLAQRMGVSPGTITKKLAKPESIDGEWLAKFAKGLGVTALELYQKPAAVKRDPRADLEAALLAYGVDRSQIELAISIIGNLVPKAADAKPERTPPRDQPQEASPRRDVAPLRRKAPLPSS